MKNIGYWYSKYEPQCPMPVENSASEEQVKQQLEIFQQFNSGEDEVFYRGWSRCRICEEVNGSSEFEKYVNGEKYGIPSGLKHYIEDHNVLVPGIFDIYK